MLNVKAHANNNNNNNNNNNKEGIIIIRRNKNLSIAWIDYQKAFDSVPHSWVEKSIALIGVNSKLLNIHGQHHPKADVDRLYVPRKQRGRGLMQLEAAHAVEIIKLVEYVDRKEDSLILVVRTHQHNTDSAAGQTARCHRTEV